MKMQKINKNIIQTTKTLIINSKEMKKFSFSLVAILGLLSTACSQDEPGLITKDDNQISFAVAAGYDTKSASGYENGTDINEITVSAWLNANENVLPGYGSPNTGNAAYFLNDVLTRAKNSGTFNYSSNARYWPANGEGLDFFAVVDNKAWGDNGKFVWKNDEGVPGLQSWLRQLPLDSMPDLLFAYTPNQKRTVQHAGQQNVSFNFNHAFAKVVVTAEVKNENLRVYITDMEIHGIVDKGIFSFPRKVGEGPIIVDTKPSWKINENYISLKSLLPGHDASNPVILDMREKATANLLGKGEKYDENGNYNKLNELLVLPYSYSGRNASTHQTYILLKGYAYNISNKENGFDEDTDCIIYPAGGKPVPADMIIPIEFNWEMGTINHYNIVFDCGNGGSITPDPNTPAFIRIGYEVEVEKWKDKDGGNHEYNW